MENFFSLVSFFFSSFKLGVFDFQFFFLLSYAPTTCRILCGFGNDRESNKVGKKGREDSEVDAQTEAKGKKYESVSEMRRKTKYEGNMRA